jgi:hypothetical protein
MLDSLRAKGSPLLILELGDFMERDPHKGPVINPFLLDQMEGEGVAAMIPGIFDLSHWPAFRELMAGRAIRMLSSDVRIREGDSLVPIAARSLVVTRADVRIGLLGVIGTEEFEQVTAEDDIVLEHQDPAAAIAELTPDLRERCDLVVVLACMADKDAVEFAEQLQGVDALLGGHVSIASDRPLRVGDVIVNRSGQRGQHLSTTRLILSPHNEIVDWGGFNFRLTKDVPGDPELRQRVAEIDREAAQARLRGLRGDASRERQRERSPRFLGESTCRTCHAEQARQWDTTRHAHAFATLRTKAKSNDPECLGCHVTGAGQRHGFRTEEATPDLVNVQCESCHGPGSEHARGDAAVQVKEQTCLVCHTSDWTPQWDVAAAWAEVRH